MNNPTVRILIVDDDARVRASLHRLVLSRGYIAECVGSGQSALDSIQRAQADLLLLDLNLPDMHGLDVIGHISARQPDLPIIVISGDPAAQIATQVLNRGANDFIRKPYAPNELLNRIEQIVGRRHLEREHNSVRKQLQSSDSLLRLLINNSPDLMLVMDRQGRIAYANDQSQRLLGIEREQLIGRHYEEVINPADRKKAQRLLSPTTALRAQPCELKFLTRHGRNQVVKPFEINVVPVDLDSMSRLEADRGKDESNIGVYCIARDISDRKHAEELRQFHASHDPVTRTPNRFVFDDRLRHGLLSATRNRTGLAVLFIDMDRFKTINDSLGHSIGDELLRAIAERLTVCLRQVDTVARVGGDEFMVLLPKVSTEAEICAVADKLLKRLTEPFRVHGHEMYVTFSVGAAIFPEHGTTVDVLKRHADAAMYYIKHRGKNGFKLYTPELGELGAASLSFEAEMRNALRNNEFELHYQPQIDLTSDEVVGMEALIRWRHPQHGLLSPAKFLDVAEETALIIPIGEWVVGQACRDLERWARAGCRPTSLAVNISAQQLNRPETVDHIIEQYSRHDLGPNQLEIEITETCLVTEFANTVQRLETLKSNGIGVAIDDFGTGYSSLSYLRNLPADKLKIDRSFVQDIEPGAQGRTLLSAIVGMANGLGMRSVAEGVETVDQRDFLRQAGCLAMQGYLYSPAVDSARAAEMLNAASELAVEGA